MPEYISLKQLESKLDFFRKMYDSVRLVDPMHKKVIDCRNSSVHRTMELCYNYWGEGRICDNCVSIRAYIENKSFVKLEKNEEVIILVTALPVANADSPVVLELMKDATDSMLVGTGDYNKGEPFRRVVREMNDMVIRDSLTSLYNRRFIDERLPVEVINATLNQSPLSICFIDLDNLKTLNDTYGHEAGDNAIQAVADVIRKHIRSAHDWAARYGGDEFLLCFNNTDEEQARAIVERIQSSVEKIPLSFQTQPAHFSVSFGIKTMKELPLTAEEIIRLADQKMYENKKNKKNQFP